MEEERNDRFFILKSLNPFYLARRGTLDAILSRDEKETLAGSDGFPYLFTRGRCGGNMMLFDPRWNRRFPVQPSIVELESKRFTISFGITNKVKVLHRLTY